MRFRELLITYRPVAGAPAGPRPRLRTAADTARLVAPLLESEAVEVVGLILVNTKLEPIAWHLLSRGCLDATLVHPREVIKAVCLANAAGVIIAHNHPSGDPEPSLADVAMSQKLKNALSIVQVELLDSIVIGDCGRFSSLRELGQL
jgi:DNA repair protein RadC